MPIKACKIKTEGKKEVALIRLSSLGDILHGLVLARELKVCIPEVSITWFVEKQFAVLLELFPMIDYIKIVDLEGLQSPLRASIWSFRVLPKIIFRRHKFQEKVYDAIIDVQGLFKSAILGRILRGGKRIGFSRSNSRELSWFFYTDKVETEGEVNLFRKNAALLGVLLGDREELEASGVGLGEIEFRPNERAEEWVNNFLGEVEGDRLVLVHPWASFWTKMLPAIQLRDLLEGIRERYRVDPLVLAGSAGKQGKKLPREKKKRKIEAFRYNLSNKL